MLITNSGLDRSFLKIRKPKIAVVLGDDILNYMSERDILLLHHSDGGSVIGKDPRLENKSGFPARVPDRETNSSGQSLVIPGDNFKS